MEYRITATTTKNFSLLLNCHVLAEGDTVFAGDPNGGNCSAPDWDDMQRQLQKNGLALAWVDYDDTTKMDEYIVVFLTAIDMDEEDSAVEYD